MWQADLVWLGNEKLRQSISGLKQARQHSFSLNEERREGGAGCLSKRKNEKQLNKTSSFTGSYVMITFWSSQSSLDFCTFFFSLALCKSYNFPADYYVWVVPYREVIALWLSSSSGTCVPGYHCWHDGHREARSGVLFSSGMTLWGGQAFQTAMMKLPWNDFSLLTLLNDLAQLQLCWLAGILGVVRTVECFFPNAEPVILTSHQPSISAQGSTLWVQGAKQQGPPLLLSHVC